MEINKELRMEFNKRFANSEQYIEIRQHAQDAVDDAPEIQLIEETPRNYFWEQRAVYNKILPIIEYFDNKYKDKVNNFVNYESLIYGENGLVERLMPLQIEYNNIRNKKNEFINRLSGGCFLIEDGSIDVDALAEEGIAPGQVIIYRQGSMAPTFYEPNVKSYEVYSSELDKIEKDIEKISLDFQNNKLEYWTSSN